MRRPRIAQGPVFRLEGVLGVVVQEVAAQGQVDVLLLLPQVVAVAVRVVRPVGQAVVGDPRADAADVPVVVVGAGASRCRRPAPGRGLRGRRAGSSRTCGGASWVDGGAPDRGGAPGGGGGFFPARRPQSPVPAGDCVREGFAVRRAFHGQGAQGLPGAAGHPRRPPRGGAGLGGPGGHRGPPGAGPGLPGDPSGPAGGDRALYPLRGGGYGHRREGDVHRPAGGQLLHPAPGGHGRDRPGLPPGGLRQDRPRSSACSTWGRCSATSGPRRAASGCSPSSTWRPWGRRTRGWTPR